MRWLLLSWLLIAFMGQLQAADDVDYQRDIKPLFAEKCGVCHGAMKQESGLRLDAVVLIREGGDGGPVVAVGNADDSRLLHKVTAEDPDERMPPEGEGAPLTAKQVALLSAWINSGARVPDNEVIPADPRQHWAYQLPSPPRLPVVDDARWSHPIDTFIAREQQRLGLRPVETADRYTLLRRVYMDLIGLPPTHEQIEEFISDESPQAWRNVVDALLDSPHYGERWGRHWMDVWRYSDWDGYKEQLRGSQRHIWRWRDWIVRSLNDDKGYDRMIVEMLAGDEVAADDPTVLPATGFLARNYHKSNRNIWLDATVEHTAKAFLGMTLNCARCHDHKFDPIPQTAYYQFRAIFEPHNVRVDRIPGQPDLMKDGVPRAFDADLDAETFLFVRGDDKHPDKEKTMRPAVPSVLGGELDIQAVELPLKSNYTPLGNEYPRTSSGRRLALARWIATDSNPLTARVAVNQIWMRHFGSPLVDHVFDFGLRSPKPRHVDLLDWLAVELMENDWSMKHLHRLIVASRTWQLASTSGQVANPSHKIDPDNQYLWRANVRRLDAEIIRDSLLAISGQLDETRGGPDIDYQQGETSRRRSIYLRHAYEKQMTMLVLFDAANPTDCYRRSESIVPQQALALMNSSLSLSQSRLLAARLWQVAAGEGDAADSSFIRLAFMQILSRPPDDEEWLACQQFLADQAETLSDPTQLTTFQGGSDPKVKPATDPTQRARENLVHVLMNHNDFVTIR